MRVLVACEFSGVVREAFRARGHDAWSCDILPTLQPGQHYQCDVREVVDLGWDLMIAHPPCQYMSWAGQRWWNMPGRAEKRADAFGFFMEMVNAPIERIAVENPRGYPLVAYRPPDDLIHPYEFGADHTKATCLWLKNLPPLMRTMVCSNPVPNWARNKKGAHTGKARSVTWQGIADAMAAQWG